MGAVEHRAISLERGIEPAGPAEFQELGDGRVVPSSGESGAARLQQPLPVASILRGQPAGVGVDGGRLGALGADPMARARGTDGIHPGTAEPDAGHQDDDEQGAPALPLEPRNAARLSLPERRPRPWDAAASPSCGSRHDGSSIVTFEARETAGTIDPVAVPSFSGLVRAPDFPEGLDWLNVARPLHIADLRGRLAIVDFWTFC